MIILVINCGSSSIKYQLLDMKSDDVYSLLAKGILERIGMPMSKLTHKPTGKDPLVLEMPVSDHKVGMKLVLDTLIDPVHGVIGSFADIDAVGHRIVQGAEYFSGSVIVDDDVIDKIRICCDYAPLHNPAHLLGIEAVSNVLPEITQVVTFDTAFHQTMEPAAYMYALPYEYYSKYRVRRYGAHGTSHLYVSHEGAAFRGYLHGIHPSRGNDNGHPLRHDGPQRRHLSHEEGGPHSRPDDGHHEQEVRIPRNVRGRDLRLP